MSVSNKDKLKELIKNAKHIVFFGGAGVSTESGIKDFRSKDGLYNLQSKYGLPYEIMLSHSYYRSHTSTFYKFYREFMITDAKPNYAHKFLAELEKHGKDVTVITQNIDGLHQIAGSKNVIELHGSIHRNYCERCGRLYDVNIVKDAEDIPLCPICGGETKPDVVLYEEPLDERVATKAMIALQNADLLIVAGTSLKVYPAAMYLNYFYGNNIVVINKEKLDVNRKITLQILGKIGEIFESLNYFD
ncbi:MAG: NAD-dependent protein deacylase [Bacilli bacterium]|nr:NAD-dependent protein deacylase [Bacilli bacterium]